MTGDPSAGIIVRSFAESILRVLGNDQPIGSLVRKELPPPDIARKYVDGKAHILGFSIFTDRIKNTLVVFICTCACCLS